jgi:hypothetical protein
MIAKRRVRRFADEAERQIVPSKTAGGFQRTNIKAV